jgi:hypothetical protein
MSAGYRGTVEPETRLHATVARAALIANAEMGRRSGLHPIGGNALIQKPRRRHTNSAACSTHNRPRKLETVEPDPPEG